MNKEQGNKLIAEFMGAIKQPHPESLYWFKNPTTCDSSYQWNDYAMQYHSSWDWLIPVCKKLESLPDVEDFSQKNYDKWVENSECLGNALWKLDITLVWETVIQFIQWYNQNQKP